MNQIAHNRLSLGVLVLAAVFLASCNKSVGIKRKKDVEIPQAKPSVPSSVEPQNVAPPATKNPGPPGSKDPTDPTDPKGTDNSQANLTKKGQAKGVYFGLAFNADPPILESLGPARRALADAILSGRGVPHEILTEAWIEREFERRGEKVLASKPALDSFLETLQAPAQTNAKASPSVFNFSDLKNVFPKIQAFHGGERIKGSSGAQWFMDTVRRNEISDVAWVSLGILISRSSMEAKAYESSCPVVFLEGDILRYGSVAFSQGGEAYVSVTDWVNPSTDARIIKATDVNLNFLHAIPYLVFVTFDDFQSEIASKTPLDRLREGPGPFSLGHAQLSHLAPKTSSDTQGTHSVNDPVRIKQARLNCDWMD